MGQVLHGSATTTEAARRAIQNSKESLRALGKRYGINQKTVAKWKTPTSVEDLRTGPNPSKPGTKHLDRHIVIGVRLAPPPDRAQASRQTMLSMGPHARLEKKAGFPTSRSCSGGVRLRHGVSDF